MDYQEDMNKICEKFNQQAAQWSLKARLEKTRQLYGHSWVFTTSFGLEDQWLGHMIWTHGVDIHVVTLDTGRLFPQTHELWDQTQKRYQVTIDSFVPDATELENLINDQGPFGFKDSLENRQTCCRIRKVHPLKRALKGHDVWVTGLRATQSQGRNGTPFMEYDHTQGLMKVNPLFDQTASHVIKAIDALEIPYNSLHDENYLSIGCQPCTRSVRLGEHERAGRWWWEKSAQECGLHHARK